MIPRIKYTLELRQELVDEYGNPTKICDPLRTSYIKTISDGDGLALTNKGILSQMVERLSAEMKY